MAADGKRWWWQRPDGSYPSNKWCLINKHYYLFDRQGYMLTGWHKWNGKIVDQDGDWYFLENANGASYEGACYHEKIGGYGALEIWEINQKNDI